MVLLASRVKLNAKKTLELSETINFVIVDVPSESLRERETDRQRDGMGETENGGERQTDRQTQKTHAHTYILSWCYR